ncbi:hypothetical protein HDU76_010875 [Blyttiomyces sp. JEL0837]|nr:hypothetical protein HDU76_010875 [Blyttiomyces sp. JEL0837]
MSATIEQPQPAASLTPQQQPPVDVEKAKAVPSVKEDPQHAATPVHYPRVFLYFALFFLPLVLSITLLASNSVWHATIDQGSPEFVGIEAFVGLTKLCVGSTTQDCVSLKDVCNDIKSGLAGEGLPYNIGDALCGDERKTALAFIILAIIAGAVAIVSYVDNLLVWSNHSLWYHPHDHTVKEVRKVRIYFQEAILIFASLHLLFMVIAVSIITHLRGQVLSPMHVELYWGLYMGVGAIVLDICFVGLFYFFDRLTFFSMPTGRKFDPIEDS